MSRAALNLVHASPEGRPDGRRLRSQESRRRIVQALLELVHGGQLEPSAELVAERAGVGLRSVFRHFKDMEGLRREMSETVEGELSDLMGSPLAGDTWRERLASVIDRRAAGFERVMPYRRAGAVQAHRSLVLQADNVRLNQTLRRTLQQVLPTEVVADAELLEALDLALCFESWIRLRIDQGLEPDAARRTLVRTVEALLAGV